jgi:DNA invertase Pin-like site-specific DNA recombinase
MKVMYIRVSTDEQKTDRQHVIAQKYEVEKIYEEKVSGKSMDDRTQLRALLDFVREGDTVIVESISRIARSTKDLLTIVDDLTSKGIHFISDKESFDTSTPTGKFVLTMFGALAELERGQLLERQREGIAVAKAQGRHLGRPILEVDEQRFANVYQDWKAGNITAVKAMETLGLTKATFYRKVKQYEADNIE